MKQIKTLSLVLLLGVLFSLAPMTSKAQLFWIGGNGGAQISWFTTPKADNIVLSVGAGWNLGFFLRYGKKPFYQIDFRWYRASHIIQYQYEIVPGIILPIEGEVPFHKFEIPVRVGYPIVYTPLFKWHVNGGPFLATTFLFSTNVFEFERDDMRNPQFGVLAGTGIQFMNFIIDIDYSYHITQLFKGDEEDLGVDFGAHLQMISLKVGFQF
ncbi:MAG: outer membrane beta-barrel protein [bacterium]|jgi:hypothetical protein